jgi:putrescine aminotransferase
MKHNLIKVEDIQGLNIDQVWELYREHINPYPVELLGAFGAGRKLVERAEGCYIYEKNGNKILDLTGGIGVLNHGHNHPRILKVRNEFAMGRKMEVHKSYFSPYVAALSHNIAQLLPPPLSVSYFPNSGAESVEGALKLAYKATKGDRSEILHADISFHGKLWAAGAVTGSIENHYKFPSPVKSKGFKFNDSEDLDRLIADSKSSTGETNFFALIVEPLNASTMTFATDKFLRHCRKVCDENGIVLIFDEVYTGWGKTGHLFNFLRVEGLVPDILCYAKSFGGGKASISGYTSTKDLALQAYGSIRDATLHSTTYFGFGEETVTAIESINVIVEDGLVQRSREIGQAFESRIGDYMESRKDKYELSGSGALWGITPTKNLSIAIAQAAGKISGIAGTDSRFGAKVFGGALVNALYEKHNILSYIGFNKTNPLIISFPLIATELEVEIAAAAIKDVLEMNPLKLITQFFIGRGNGPKAL